jgi:putative transposase
VAQDWPQREGHLAGRDDGLVSVGPLLQRAPRFADLVDGEPDSASFAPLRRSELIGRQLGRIVTPGKRGPKPKGDGKQRDKKIKTDGPVIVIRR